MSHKRIAQTRATIAGVGVVLVLVVSLVSPPAALAKAHKLTSISVTPTNAVTTWDVPVQFLATGTYADGSTQDLTTAATWTSSDLSTAFVSNDPGYQGLTTFYPWHIGGATISATVMVHHKTVTGSTTIYVGTPFIYCDPMPQILVC